MSNKGNGIEREAWDAVEKERLNYIDKKKLIEWLKSQAHLIPAFIENEIASGRFDIKEDETHG